MTPTTATVLAQLVDGLVSDPENWSKTLSRKSFEVLPKKWLDGFSRAFSSSLDLSSAVLMLEMQGPQVCSISLKWAMRNRDRK